MKKTRMAMLGVALVAGLSTMALAQGGGGGGGGGGRGGRGGARPAPSAALMAGIALNGADSAKIHVIDSVYSAARTQVYRDNGVMQAGGNRGGGGGGGGGGMGAAIPDSVKAKLQPAIQKWQLDLRAALGAADKQAAFDANVKTFDPFAPPARRGGGGGGR